MWLRVPSISTWRTVIWCTRRHRVRWRTSRCPSFLHVTPKKPYVLPEGRREVGFDNLDFKFFQRGLRWEGRCHAEVPLPEYEIDLIRTGQFVADDEVADGGDRPNEGPASGAWNVEIPLAR